jgi:hypothetical protein
MNSIAETLKLQQNDWSSISSKQVRELGGSGVLDQYNGSLVKGRRDCIGDSIVSLWKRGMRLYWRFNGLDVAP